MNTRRPYIAFLLANFLFLGTAFAQEAAQPRYTSLEEAIAVAATWNWGQDPAPLEFIKAEVLATQGDLDARNRVGDLLAPTLTGDGTDAFKLHMARNLYLIATAQQAETIAPLLREEKYSTLARTALEAVPGEAVDKAFLEALNETTGEVQRGLIASVGARKLDGARETLFALVRAANVENPEPLALLIALDAVDALAEIGGKQVIMPLSAEYDKATRALKVRLLEAALRLAEKLMQGSEADRKLAFGIHDSFYRVQEGLRFKVAGLHGNMENVGDTQGVEFVRGWFAEQPAENHRYAMPYVRTLPGEEATTAFANMLVELPDESKVTMLQALSDRGDPMALAHVESLLTSDSPDVVRAAIATIGALGDAGVVAELIPYLLDEDATTADVARAALAKLRGGGVDAVIIKRLEAAEEDATKRELISLLEARQARDAFAALETLAGSGSDELRARAMGALGALANTEQIGVLVSLALAADTDATRNAATGALTAALRRTDGETASAPVLAALDQDIPDAAAQTLVKALGASHDPDTLATLEVLAGDGTRTAVQSAALEALGNWNDSAPLDTLLERAKAGSDGALAAYVRLLNADAQRAVSDKLARYAGALDLAKEIGDKRAILSGLSKVRDIGALDLVTPYLQDEDLKREAQVAADSIRESFYVPSASHKSEDADKALDKNIDTRWATGTLQAPGQWFQVDLGREVTLGGILLDSSRSKNDYPTAYEVYVFNGPEDMGSPVASGTDAKPVLKISFAPVTGRYVRIVQTGSSPSFYWSIHELRFLSAE